MPMPTTARGLINYRVHDDAAAATMIGRD